MPPATRGTRAMSRSAASREGIQKRARDVDFDDDTTVPDRARPRRLSGSTIQTLQPNDRPKLVEGQAELASKVGDLGYKDPEVITAPVLTTLFTGLYFIVDATIWRPGPKFSTSAAITKHGGQVVANRMPDGVDLRPLLVIPSPEDELPPFSGTAARMAHGIGSNSDPYAGLTRASHKWVIRCITSGLILPHDVLGLPNKPAPELFCIDSKGRKIVKHDTLDAVDNAERQRLHLMLLGMDRFFTESTKKSGEKFFAAQEAEDKRQGRTYRTSTKTFCRKYVVILNDCSPGFRQVSRRKWTKKPNTATAAESSPGPDKTLEMGPHTLGSVLADSGFPTPAPSVDSPSLAHPQSPRLSPAIDPPSPIQSFANSPCTVHFEETPETLYEGASTSHSRSHSPAFTDAKSGQLAGLDGDPDTFLDSHDIERPGPNEYELSDEAAVGISPGGGDDCIGHDFDHDAGHGEHETDYEASRAADTLSSSHAQRELLAFVNVWAIATLEPHVDAILPFARHCTDPSAPCPEIAATEVLVNALGACLASARAEPKRYFARTGFLRLYSTYRHYGYRGEELLRKALGPDSPMLSASSHIVTPYTRGDHISLVELDLSKQLGTIYLASPPKVADDDQSKIEDAIRRFTVETIENDDRQYRLSIKNGPPLAGAGDDRWWAPTCALVATIEQLFGSTITHGHRSSSGEQTICSTASDCIAGLLTILTDSHSSL